MRQAEIKHLGINGESLSRCCLCLALLTLIRVFFMWINYLSKAWSLCADVWSHGVFFCVDYGNADLCDPTPRGSTPTCWVHRWENWVAVHLLHLFKGVSVSVNFIISGTKSVWKEQQKGGIVYFWLMDWEISVHCLWQHSFGSVVKLSVKMAGEHVLEEAFP